MGALGWLVIGGIAFLVLFAWVFGQRRAPDRGDLPPSSTTKFRPPRSSDRTARIKQASEKRARGQDTL